MIRLLLYAAFLSLIVAGCLRVRGEHYTYREPVTIDTTKLRLDGYYYREFVTSPDSQKLIWPIVLWRDGTAVYFTGSFGGPYVDEDGTSYPFGETYEGTQEDFQEYLSDLERDTGSEANWGAFRLRGDAISIQVMFVVSPQSSTFATNEYNGTVINDTTFILNELYLPRDDSRTQISRTYHFRPLEDKPTSENWTQTHRKLR